MSACEEDVVMKKALSKIGDLANNNFQRGESGQRNNDHQSAEEASRRTFSMRRFSLAPPTKSGAAPDVSETLFHVLGD